MISMDQGGCFNLNNDVHKHIIRAIMMFINI